MLQMTCCVSLTVIISHLILFTAPPKHLLFHLIGLIFLVFFVSSHWFQMELGEIVQTQVTTPLVPTSVAIAGSNPVPVASELSNVSSTGSVSDREPETPDKGNYIKVGKSLDQKPLRKRRRNDGYPPKSDRKITECFKVFLCIHLRFLRLQ